MNKKENLDVRELNFDEFHAIRNRKRMSNPEPEFECDLAASEDTISEIDSNFSVLGQAMEMREFQLLVVVLILVDFFCVTFSMLSMRYMAQSDDVGSYDVKIIQSFCSLVNVCMGFTIVFFVLELALSMLAFGKQFFKHLGYCLDVAIIVAIIYGEVQYETKLFRVLGLLRAWRAVRIVNNVLHEQNLQVQSGERALAAESHTILQQQNEISVLETSLAHERTSSERLLVSLRGLKDEVETLKEALQIAACSVAEAATLEYGDQIQEDFAVLSEVTMTKSENMQNVATEKVISSRKHEEFQDAFDNIVP